jgi:hypothetical protein
MRKLQFVFFRPTLLLTFVLTAAATILIAPAYASPAQAGPQPSWDHPQHTGPLPGGVRFYAPLAEHDPPLIMVEDQPYDLGDLGLVMAAIGVVADPAGGIGCGSCHAQTLVILGGANGTLSDFYPVEDAQISLAPGIGFQVQQPVRLPDEPLCCPSTYSTAWLVWDGSRFVWSDNQP